LSISLIEFSLMPLIDCHLARFAASFLCFFALFLAMNARNLPLLFLFYQKPIVMMMLIAFFAPKLIETQTMA